MMRVGVAIGVVLAALAGCSRLPPLPSGCGNGILEPGEDCDVHDPRCVACGWTCDPAAGASACATIPAPRDGSAYACGADDMCHAPGGQLAGPASQAPFSANTIVVGDVDHDGYGDVIGPSAVSLVTRYGDPEADMATEGQLVTPGTTGVAAVTDLDGDGTADLLLPARDGLVAYASPHHQLASYPIAFPLELGGAVIEPLAAFPIHGSRFGVLYDVGGKLAGATFDARMQNQATGGGSSFAVCDASSASLDPDSLAAYDLTTGVTPAFAVSFMAGSTLCVIETGGAGSPTATAFAAPQRGRAVLADLSGTGCPALVVARPSGNVGFFAATGSPGACGLAATATRLDGAPYGAAPVGRIALSPPEPGYEPDALVLDAGAYKVSTAFALAVLYPSDRALTGAASGDLDHDGLVDAVVTGADATLDVLHRVRSASQDGFVRVRLATESPPSHLVISDFDGDGYADLAYIDDPGAGPVLEVAFGTADHLLPAVEAGAFSDVAATLPLDLFDSNDPDPGAGQPGFIGDLGVLDRRSSAGSGAGSVIVALHGSPNRDLIPFLDPRTETSVFSASARGSTFAAVAAGSFATGGAAPDVLAIELPDPAPNGGTASAAILWRLAGLAPGVAAPIDGAASGCAALDPAVIGACTQDAQPAFCLDRAHLLRWPGAGTDLVVGLDPVHAQGLVLAPAGAGYGTTDTAGACSVDLAPSALALPAIAALPAKATLRDELAANLDGSGDQLVIAFATDTGGGVLACTVSATDLSCRDLIAQVPDLAGVVCTAAAPGRLGLAGQTRDEPAPTTTDLAVACGDALYRVFHAPDGYHATLLATLPFAPHSLAVGDVNGDGLDDVLVTGALADGLRRLVVYPQKTSRQVTR